MSWPATDFRRDRAEYPDEGLGHRFDRRSAVGPARFGAVDQDRQAVRRSKRWPSHSSGYSARSLRKSVAGQDINQRHYDPLSTGPSGPVEASDRSFATLPLCNEQSPEVESTNPTTQNTLAPRHRRSCLL